MYGIVGEFDDGGLMKTFGASGVGAFPAPLTICTEIEQLCGVELVGVLDCMTKRYYAISTERRATDPQVVKLLALADRLLTDTTAVPQANPDTRGPRMPEATKAKRAGTSTSRKSSSESRRR